MKKKIISVCLSVFMLMQCVGALAAAGVYPDSVLDTTVDIMENGGFENDGEGWINSGYYTINSEVAKSGSKSLAFIRKQTAPTYVTARKVLEVEKNTDYTVSYSAKQISGGHVFTIYGNTISTKIKETFHQTASEDWVDSAYTVNSGENDKLIIEIKDFSSVDAEIYFDDIKVIAQAEEPTPKVNTLINGGLEWGSTGWDINGQIYFNAWGNGPRSGKNGLYIHKNTYWHSYAVQEIDVEKNKNFEFSYWYQNGDATLSGHQVRIYIGEGKKEQAYVSNASNKEWYTSTANVTKKNAAATEWTKETLTFFTGENEKIYIRFMPEKDQSTQATMIDDMHLKLLNPGPFKETVMNGDMEGGKRASDQNAPTGWRGWYSLTQDQAHSGSNSMVVKNTRPNYDSMYNDILVEPNTDYTLEWYEMRQNGAYGVKIPNTTLASAGIFYNANGSTEWVKQTVNFNSLENSTIALQFMKNQAQGTEDDTTKYVYFDDVKLTRKSAYIESAEILGYPSNGKTLYASAEANDTYSNLKGISYQWQSSADGVLWTDIEGATSDTYDVEEDTLFYRVGAAANFAVAYNKDAALAQSQYVYSDMVSASDSDGFEEKLCSDITTTLAIIPDSIVWNEGLYRALVKDVTVAREYGIDLAANVSNYSKYLEFEGKLVEIKDSSIAYQNEDIEIDLEFTTYANEADITKENIVLEVGREGFDDYTITAVKENGNVTGAKITLKNSISNDEALSLTVKIGEWCDFSEVYTVAKPVTLENVLLKNSSGDVVDRPADITDGKLTFTADVKNNTYTEGKTVKIITAVYNGNTLYGAKVTPATVAKDSTYPLNVTMDIPTTGLTENWITATFVWDDDGITPLVKKNSKTFGIDVINDSTKDITVAFIGGSITQGKNYTDPFIEKWQQDRTGKITMINAGIGGTNSSYGTMRMYEDVLSKNPDIVFVEFTLNDSWLSEAQTKKNVESMIRQCYNSEHQPVISFIHIPDRRTNADGSYTLSEKIGYYNTVMEYYGLTPFNAHQLVVDEINAEGSIYTWDSFVSEGNVHPDSAQGENIATVMYSDFKANSEKYIKNIKWNPEKGFGADDYSEPSIVSSSKANYDSNWKNNTVDGVVTEGYGVPTKLPFESFMASSIAGAKMSFKFRGTKLIISSLMGKLGKNATYTITNEEGVVEKSGTLSTYIADFNWYENIILSVDGLEDTKHTLTVTVKDGDGLFGIGEFWVDE